MRVLDDGFTELFARELAQKNYPTEHSKRKDATYSGFVEVAQSICNAIGREKVQKAYFSRNLQMLFEELAAVDRNKAIEVFLEMNNLGRIMENEEPNNEKIVAKCKEICRLINWFGKKKGGFDSDRPTPSDSESRTERTGGYAGDRGGFDRGAVSSSQAEELSRTLINLNFENKAQLQKAEKMLWGFMAAGYRRYLGPIPTDCDPEVKLYQTS